MCLLQAALKLEGHDNELEQERLRGSNIAYGEKVQVHLLAQTAGNCILGIPFTLSSVVGNDRLHAFGEPLLIT